MMNNETPEAFFREMAPVTRALLVGTFGVTLGFVLGLFDIRFLLLDWLLIAKKFHFWRLFTDYLFVGPFSFGWVFHMYFFVTFSSKLERHPSFSPRLVGYGGYLFFICLQMLALDLISLVFYPPVGKPLLGGALNFAIIYYWSKKEPFATVGLWGFSLTAWQAPYALLVLDVLMGQSIWENLMGIATGHVYHFVRDVLPVEKNIHLLDRTPSIFGILAEKLDFFASSSTSSSSGSREETPYSSGTGATTSSNTNPSQATSNFATLFGRGNANSSNTEFSGRGYRLGGNDTSSTTR